MTFGQVLRRLRKERGLTQKELADVFNISESTVGMYERGQREPDFETLKAIADFFSVDMDSLTGRSTVLKHQPCAANMPPQAENSFSITIGKRISDRRKDLGMTQVELAKKAGYASWGAISKIETGRIDFSVLDSLSRIAGVLGLTLQDLLPENEETVQDTKQIPLAENLRDLIQELRTLIGELRGIRGECSTMSFSEKLHDLRIKAGLTQEDLAKKIGISKQNISRYEKRL